MRRCERVTALGGGTSAVPWRGARRSPSAASSPPRGGQVPAAARTHGATSYAIPPARFITSPPAPPTSPPTTSQCSVVLHRRFAGLRLALAAAGQAGRDCRTAASLPEWLDGPRRRALGAGARGAAKISHDQRPAAVRRVRFAGSPARASTTALSRRCRSATPPPRRALVLSIVHHLDIEVRDPHEATREDPLRGVARRAASTRSARCGGGRKAARGGGELRFGVGQRVQRNVGVGEWATAASRASSTASPTGQGGAAPGAARRRPLARRPPYRPPHPAARRAAAATEDDEAAPAPAAASASGGGGGGPGGTRCAPSSSSSSCCRAARGEARGGAAARGTGSRAPWRPARRRPTVPRRVPPPDFFDAAAAPRREWLDESFAAALDAGDADAVAAALRSPTECRPEVRLEMLAELLRGSVVNSTLRGRGFRRATNSMNNYGVG